MFKEIIILFICFFFNILDFKHCTRWKSCKRGGVKIFLFRRHWSWFYLVISSTFYISQFAYLLDGWQRIHFLRKRRTNSIFIFAQYTPTYMHTYINRFLLFVEEKNKINLCATSSKSHLPIQRQSSGNFILRDSWRFTYVCTYIRGELFISSIAFGLRFRSLLLRDPSINLF